MTLNRTFLKLLAVLVCTPSAFAQNAASDQSKPSAPTQTKPAVTNTGQARTSVPQVVTVLHRLNGLKMFRLLLRSEQGVAAIANFDETFKLMDDVHTNVIAGLALDDGVTIAARLPQVDLEFPVPFPPPGAPVAPMAPQPRLELGGSFLSPDLTVIDSEGSRRSATFVGVDGATGLSILKISGKLPTPPRLQEGRAITVGAGVRLLGPEPAPRNRFGASSFYVRIGEASGTISYVMQAPSGAVARLKARAARQLSSENVGGIALNTNGDTIGIVDSVEGAEANILPASEIQAAAARVLTHHSSVPKPWLGVKGNPIASLAVEQIQRQGWELMRASSLAQGHQGILLTSITPDSPAALAELRAGDVIMKVNNSEIQTAEDFSWLLNQAGPSGNVEFTVLKPNRNAEEVVSVVLSASPRKSMGLPQSTSTPLAKTRWLFLHGIETIALRPMVASRFGSTAGLLVVHVEPGTPAFNAGLLPGDVIESINGRSALSPSGILTFPTANAENATFSVIRKKQKLVITITAPAVKK